MKKCNKEIETKEGTGAGGGASTGAFSGPLTTTIDREIGEGLNLAKTDVVRPYPTYALLLYRDGSNYKTAFTVLIPNNLQNKIKLNQEYAIEDFNVSAEDMWDLAGGFRPDDDHNLVDVIQLYYTDEVPDNGQSFLDSNLSEGLNLAKINLFNNTKTMNEGLNLQKQKVNQIYNAENTKQIVGVVSDDNLEYLIDNEFVWNDGKKWITTNTPDEIISELANNKKNVANLYDPKKNITLTNKDLETEIDEGTDIASVGAGGHGSGFAYIDPYGKGYHKGKNMGTWAKNEASMRWNQKPWYKEGTFVQVKEKCKKFPYCNQGNAGALKYSNPKSAGQNVVKEDVDVLNNELKSKYNITILVEEEKVPNNYKFVFTETIPVTTNNIEYLVKLSDFYLKYVKNDFESFNVADPQPVDTKYYIYIAIDEMNDENNGDNYYYEGSSPYGFMDKESAINHAKEIIKKFNNKLSQLKENKSNYNKTKIMGTANKLKEYENKFLKNILKEHGFSIGLQDDTRIIDMDPHSIALEIKDKLPKNPTDVDVFDSLCDIGYCGNDSGAMLDNVMSELVNMNIDITLSESKQWIQKATQSIEKRNTKGKCTPITKKNCTGKSKTLAKTFKKISQNENKTIYHDMFNLSEGDTPGITMYDKIHKESGVSNKGGIKRSMTNASRLNKGDDKTENDKLSAIGKGEPKYGNFDKDKKEYDDNYIGVLRGMGLQDLQFDTEPAEDYKKRSEEAIIGSSRMGNNPDWANAQRDFDGTKGELGQKIIDIANKKKEMFDGSNKQDHYSIRMKYPLKTHEKTHIAVNENKTFQNLKTKKVIYFEKDIETLIPESHKIEGATFKLFDGNSTMYDLKWEGNTLVVESEKNNKIQESEIKDSKKLMNYTVGSYKIKPKGYK